MTDLDDPQLAKALSHPLRVRILRVLEGGIASPNEIARQLDAPLPNVSYHVRALARAGLVRLERTEPRRGAVEHYYSSAGRLRVSEKAWSEIPAIVKARLVDAALGQIGELAAAAAVGGGFERGDAVLSRQGFILDEQGFREASQKARELIDDVREIEAESRKRLEAAGPHHEPTVPSCLATLLFEDVSAEPVAAGSTSSRKRRGNATAAS